MMKGVQSLVKIVPLEARHMPMRTRLWYQKTCLDDNIMDEFHNLAVCIASDG